MNFLLRQNQNVGCQMPFVSDGKFSMRKIFTNSIYSPNTCLYIIWSELKYLLRSLFFFSFQYRIGFHFLHLMYFTENLISVSYYGRKWLLPFIKNITKRSEQIQIKKTVCCFFINIISTILGDPLKISIIIKTV